MPSALLLAALAVPASSVGPGVAAPHGGPPLTFQFFLSPGAIELRVRGEQRVWDAWLGIGEVYEEELPLPAARALLPMVEAQFGEHGTVVVDGVELAPQACSIDWWLAFGLGDGAPGLEVWFLFQHDGPLAETLAFTWDEFAEIDGRDDYFERIPVGFKVDGVYSYGDVWTWEPTYAWHRSAERDRIEFVPPPELVPPDPWRVPVATLALVVVGLGGLVWLRVVGASSGVTASFVVLAGALAWGLRDRAVVAWVPPGERVAELPDEEGALELFERLHRNVYAAFAAETESDIYDVLARSVAPELLDDLYGEVYESLILRDEGGARCEIERIDPYERAISSMDPETATFTVDYAWRVYGSVFHYEHAHNRLNQYRARYWVRHDGAQWRIAAVDTREHMRIGDTGELEVLYLEEPEEAAEELRDEPEDEDA